ncbi:hypothetical protein [Desulfovibrio inopinatus]|uniref:hypothetical protein n=1 Tax=Desulfovibrio inopinatus TaxID=102109 RepID=UPI0003F62FFE|nr:hypothetical protein [Desulfovibrio inopinatus]
MSNVAAAVQPRSNFLMDHFALSSRQHLAKAKIERIAAKPPQVLIIEGGVSVEREKAALRYTAALNCLADDAPCGHCEICNQIAEKVFMDLIFLDGRTASIKVDEIRELRLKVGEPPRGSGMRVVVMAGAQGLTEEAANALLKSMEEPRPGNVFVLLAPQRERLFSTLVSRSWVLTLAWPDRKEPAYAAHQTPEGENLDEWKDALAGFIQSARGWFARTGVKKRVDKTLAQAFLLALERDLADALVATPDSAFSSFLLSRYDVRGLRQFDLVLSHAQEALNAGVSPTLVLDWTATRMFALGRRGFTA